MELIFATANKSKLKEAAEILSDYEIVSPLSLGIVDDIKETGRTLEENSRIKARAIFHRTGRMCFADDTGLEVDALNGAPGVNTARYAGESHDSNANMDKLLQELGANTYRKARFRAVITLILEDAREYQFEGRLEGSITLSKAGCGGFGYDPVFAPGAAELSQIGVLDAEGQLSQSTAVVGDEEELPLITLAQLSEEQKNAISHRGKALRQMRNFLEKSYICGSKL